MGADCRHDEKLAIAEILIRESGLPLGGLCVAKKDRSAVLEEGKWELVRYLFGIRSKADLEAVVDLADLEKRIDEGVPDRERDRLDASVRRIALKERITPPHAKYRPPFRVADLESLVLLVNRSPLYLSRWYAARCIQDLHLIAWEGPARERRRAVALSTRIGKAIGQSLGSGRQLEIPPVPFAMRVLFLKPFTRRAFEIAKKGQDRDDAVNRLQKEYPTVPWGECQWFIECARTLRTPRALLIKGLARWYPDTSRRHIYRLLQKTET